MQLTTAEGTYSSKTAIIAAGIGAFQPNRLNVAGASEFEGRGVSYVVREREKFLGRRLLVVGGGDTAVDWSLELRNGASEVTLIHRFDYFEAHQRSVLALYDSQVKVHTQNELMCVSGNGVVERAVIRDHVTENERTLKVDDILVCIGFRADLGPINHWGLNLQSRRIEVNRQTETSIDVTYSF